MLFLLSLILPSAAHAEPNCDGCVDKYNTPIPCGSPECPFGGPTCSYECPGALELVENGRITVMPGQNRRVADQTCPRDPICPDDATNWPPINGGTAHVACQFGSPGAQGCFFIERWLLDGSITGYCWNLSRACGADTHKYFVLNTVGYHTASIGDGNDPTVNDDTLTNCFVDFWSDPINRLYKLPDTQLAITGKACVVGPTSWIHPASFPHSAGDPPTTLGVTIGPSQTLLRTMQGFSGPVRLCVYDPSDTTRRRWFTAGALTLSATWDGKLYHYLAPQGEAVPQQDPASPTYYIASGAAYGVFVEVYTQDEVHLSGSPPGPTTTYANPAYTFDYEDCASAPAGLLVFTPLE